MTGTGCNLGSAFANVFPISMQQESRDPKAGSFWGIAEYPADYIVVPLTNLDDTSFRRALATRGAGHGAFLESIGVRGFFRFSLRHVPLSGGQPSWPSDRNQIMA